MGEYSEGIQLILIADSSALITLAVCDSLYLLDLLFQEVKVPMAVYKEVIRESKKEVEKLNDYLSNKVLTLEIERDIIIKEGTIEIGELEAMLLYKQLKANRLLVDDQRARKVAELNQIKIIGSLGVLLLSKKEGHITNIKSRIEMIKNSDIYLSEELLQRIMSLAGES